MTEYERFIFVEDWVNSSVPYDNDSETVVDISIRNGDEALHDKLLQVVIDHYPETGRYRIHSNTEWEDELTPAWENERVQ